jgi:hypothetical protein
MKTFITIALAVLTSSALVGVGAAATGYPVSGTWTYDGAAEPGPARTCGARTMRFAGDMRYDTGGSVPQAKNKSTVQTGSELYQITDTFYNGQTWGDIVYTLGVRDSDHIEINYAKGGTFKLRRCS